MFSGISLPYVYSVFGFIFFINLDECHLNQNTSDFLVYPMFFDYCVVFYQSTSDL